MTSDRLDHIVERESKFGHLELVFSSRDFWLALIRRRSPVRRTPSWFRCGEFRYDLPHSAPRLERDNRSSAILSRAGGSTGIVPGHVSIRNRSMTRSLLAIDAGNSRLKFGLFVPSHSSFYRRTGATVSKIVDVPGEFPSCRRFVAVPVDDPIPWETLTSWQPSKTVIAGSNPQAIDRVLAGWNQTKLAAPMVVRNRESIAIDVDVDFPEKVGLDRLLNAVAANALRPAPRPAIVVDSGTATTVNFISPRGAFQGGAILPGLEMSAKALNHYTAVLPLIPVQDLGGELPIAPGRNTREAIRNGLFWGQVGAIRELVRQLCKQQGFPEPDLEGLQDVPDSPWLILTGGGGPVLSSQFPGVLSLPSLGMHGLVLTAWRKGA